MDQHQGLGAQRDALQKRIQVIVINVLLFVLLAFLSGFDAVTGGDNPVITITGLGGLAAWTMIVLLELESGPNTDSFRYCLAAGLVALGVDFIVFSSIKVRVWSTIPFVLFLSFWASFATERCVGLISRPVERYLKRAVPAEQPATQGDGQAQPGILNPSPEVVPLTSVTWEGRDERASDLPPDYECNLTDTPRSSNVPT
ncbi:hypothetical protein PG993_010896 [Apiospora rasikravindrae]|uniref:Uncharacterized protein n=1 Tax=Apiospora rasikravindrae TaxID=990691 RepID=A0ABR1SCQ9_9PEZI